MRLLPCDRLTPVMELMRAAGAELAASDHATVRTQITVSMIPAPTGDEGERASWVAQRFTELGLTRVRTDAAGNVIGRRPAAAGAEEEHPVVVCAHLDTVFPRGIDLRVREEGERLVGPGIGDNGRGLAAMLALPAVLDRLRVGTRRPVDFVATTGEEGLGDLRGAKHLFANGYQRAAAAMALDGSGDSRIVHRALGSRRFRVCYRGPGGHSWAAFGVPNAAHAAGAAVARIAELPLPREPRTTVSVGRIGGGFSVNAIPEEAWLEVDLRSSSTAMLDRYAREIRWIADSAAHEENARRHEGTPPLLWEVQPIGDRPGGETSADSPLVRDAVAATRLVGRDPELVAASTDANAAISRGVPAIAIGAGGCGGETHTVGEWYSNTDGALGVLRAFAVLVSAAGVLSTPARGSRSGPLS